MVCCWNVDCGYEYNATSAERCGRCGAALTLRDRYRAAERLSVGSDDRGRDRWKATDLDRPDRPIPCVVTRFAFGDPDTPARDRAIAQFQQTVASLKTLAGRLQLPPLLDTWQSRDARSGYVVRGWVEGQTLAHEFASREYGEDEVRSRLADLLATVQYIHSRRLIHGYLHPATIVRTVTGDAERCIPIDFSRTQPRDRRSPVPLPTETDYCAPEDLRGQLAPASDLYSLGAISVQLLTGLSPLELYDAVDDRWIWRDFVPPDRAVRPQFGRVLDRLLATQLDRRYARAIDALQDLDALPDPAAAIVLDHERRDIEPIALTVPIPPAPMFWQRWLGIVEPARSPTGLDCTHLRDRLAARDWASADRETAALLRTATAARSRYLDARDIAALDAEDLAFLDRLWREASGDRFGFTVQQRIYRECKGDYVRFCGRVGWPLATTQSSAEPWRDRDAAPEGYWPSRRWTIATAALRVLQAMFASIDRHQLARPLRYVPPDSSAMSS